MTQSQHWHLSGIIEKDAKGLWVRLESRFSRAELERLSESYQKSLRQGFLNNDVAFRPEGVSFNPLPARLAALLLAETPHTDFAHIEAAFALPAKLGAAGREGGDDLSAAAAECLKAGPKAGMPPGALDLAAAYALDEVRHLHQVRPADPSAVLSRAGKIAEDLAVATRLRTLLSAAIERYHRHHGVR